MPFPEGPQLVLFLTSSLILLVLPGPAVFYILARTIQQGWQAGVLSASGVAIGSLFHIAAGAVGLWIRSGRLR